MKAVSPIVSVVILISIVVIIAGIVGPWAFNLAQTSTNQTGTQINREILCRGTAYDFVSSFGTNGVEYDFSGPQYSDYIRAMIRNQGSVNVYGFSFEATINSASGVSIKKLAADAQSQKTKDDPLKPGESALLSAFFQEDIDGSLQRLTVLNSYDCPPLSQEL